MIAHLSGTLLAKNPPQIVLDVHGVGYELDVPMSTFYKLPDTGQPVSLHTQLVIREDAHVLFGFATQDEKHAVRQLLKVSGIGARTALAVLSGMSVEELVQAVTLQESARIIKIPGIGKKTAERLLLELRDKLAAALPAAAASAQAGAVRPANDILNALLALGYSEREAAAAIKALPDEISVSDGIRAALKSLSRL